MTRHASLLLRGLAGCAVLVTALAASASAQAPTADSYLVVSGAAGDGFTGGQGRFFTHGTWTATASDRNGDGPVDLVVLTCQQTTPDGQNHYWTMWFGSALPGALEPGFYPRAGGFDPSPFFVIGGEGYGGGTYGTFTVLDAAFDTSGGTLVVERFAARFEDVGNKIYGAVSYQAPPARVLTSAAYNGAKGVLTVSGERLDGVRALEIDGALVSTKPAKNDVLKAKGLALGEGDHSIVAVAEDGARTPPLVANFGLRLPNPPADRSTVVLDGDTSDAPSFVLRGDGFTPYVVDNDGDGNIDVFDLFFFDPNNPGSIAWRLYFATFGFGRQLVPGDFPNANGQFRPDGDAKFWITSNVYGCSDSSGHFRISDVVVDTTTGFPRLQRYAATFEQSCFDGASRVHGSVTYSAPTPPVMGHATYAAAERRLTVSGLYFSQGAKVVVDGRELTPASTTSKSAVVEGVDLDGRVHAVIVRNRDGYVTRPYMIVR